MEGELTDYKTTHRPYLALALNNCKNTLTRQEKSEH